MDSYNFEEDQPGEVFVEKVQQSTVNTQNTFAHTSALIESVKWALCDFRHEMANMLNGITVTIEYLHQFVAPGMDEETVGMIEASLRQLEIAREVMAPLENYERPGTIVMESVPAEPLITTVCGQIQQEANGVAFFRITIEPVSLTIHTNATVLGQVLYLLGIHTLRTLKGIKGTEVTVSVTNESGNTVICYEDNRYSKRRDGTNAEISQGIVQRGDTFALFLAKALLARIEGELKMAETGAEGERMTIILAGNKRHESKTTI